MALNSRTKKPGNLWRTGNGVPGPSLGGENDLYRDLATGLDYQKIAGAWGLIIQPTLPTSKLTGQIGDAQISDVSAGKITGTIPSGHLGAGSVTTTEILDGTIQQGDTNVASASWNFPVGANTKGRPNQISEDTSQFHGIDSGNIVMVIPGAGAVGAFASYRIAGGGSIPVGVVRDISGGFRVYSAVDSVSGSSFRGVATNDDSTGAQTTNFAWIADVYGI